MSRYRKLHTRMWNDERFRELTPIPPCGQGLWVRLLSGPETGVVPGLIEATEAGLASRLRWSIKDFRDAFAEIEAQGMVEADWDAGLVWLPNAVRYNEPASPNVVKAWVKALEEMPECPLQVKAVLHLEAFLKDKGEAFRYAFRKAITKANGKGSANPYPKQEQEQEQDQDTGTVSGEQTGPPSADAEGSPPPTLVVKDGDQTSLAWVETGLWIDQLRADPLALDHVPDTLATLVRDFGDPLVARCSRDYDRWRRDKGKQRTARRKRHDRALATWAKKEFERGVARGELQPKGPLDAPDTADLDARVKDLEAEGL